MADLAGGLHELRPATVLAFLTATAKTGVLRVSGRHTRINVWLVDGVTVAAETPAEDDALLDQLVELLRTPAGSFEFEEGESPRPDRVVEPSVDLLPQAVARLHEWEPLADAVPSLSLVVKLLNADDEHVQLSAAAWSVSVAVASGHSSVASVAKHLKWSSFKTCQAVRELVDAGRATLVAPAKRRRGGRHNESVVSGPGVWHPSNQPLWPGSGADERERFTNAWASYE